MKNILVTGGAGYIGSHAVRALIEKGYRVTVLDNLAKGYEKAVHPEARFVLLDLADKNGVQQLFSENTFDAVLHFAGLIEVGLSMEDPALFFENNVVYGIHLLEAMRKAEVKNIIFSSTAAVYGYPDKTPIPEDAPLRPTNFYGASKLAFENILQNYEQFYGFRFIALRYFNAAGADPKAEIGQAYDPATHLIPRALQFLQGFLPDFMMNGDDYPTPDGTCIRDYIHVADLVDAHIFALEYLFSSQSSNSFNLGNGNGFSVREVLDTIEKVTGKKFEVPIGPRRPGDPPVLVADAGKARRVLGWNPKFSALENIVESAWKWHSGHPKGYRGE